MATSTMRQKSVPELEWSMLVNGLNAIKPRFARPAVEEGSVGVAMVDGSEGLNTDFDDMIFD